MEDYERILVFEIKNRMLRAAHTIDDRLDLMPTDTENLQKSRALAHRAINNLKEAAALAAVDELNPQRRGSEKEVK